MTSVDFSNINAVTLLRVQNWFEANSVNVFDWPERSPDLNPIENLRGLLARVYKCVKFLLFCVK